MRALFIAISLLLNGCAGIAYYGQAALGQMQVMAASRAVDDVLADATTDQQVRQLLQRLPALRQFARDELKLADGDSYRSYAGLGRDAMVWSVVAAPADSLVPREWCYPIIGCAAYRGYFRESAARSHAQSLQQQGWDVAVEPVPAYSTLGWFNDPLPSTVLHWSMADVAGLLFHELAHETLYLPGDSAFNEAYATLVEKEGVRRWLARQQDPALRMAWEQRESRGGEFVQLLNQSCERLAALYAQQHGNADWQQRKRQIFQDLRDDYAGMKERWQGYAGYDRWFDRPLNNAHLASVMTYRGLLPAFQALLDREGGDMTSFHTASRELSRLPEADRVRALAQLINVSAESRQ